MEFLQNIVSTPWAFLVDYGLPFLIVLSILVFVHEWGHYIVARMCGVKVEKFSIGFGRELFGFDDKNGTRWKFSMIPLGGYVQMFGDTDPASAGHSDEAEEGAKKRKLTKAERKVAFFSQSIPKRAAIVFAGPAINFIFAIILLAGMYAVHGQPFTPPVAASIIEGAPADIAGIQPDDKIVSINGKSIRTFEDIVQQVAINLNQELDVTVLRSTGELNQWDEANPIDLTLVPELTTFEDRFGFKHSKGLIGIASPEGETGLEEHNIASAIVSAGRETWNITVGTLQALGQMITGARSPDELGGILRIGAYAGEFAQAGIVSLISFAALLSINLGLINLFPIPMLDGGHLAMYGVEAIKGKPLTERTQEYAFRFGFAAVVCFMLFATWNDLVQLSVIDYLKSIVS